MASAQSLVSKAIACGFRESGITNSSKRVIIAIRCSIRLEVPLGSSDEIMVSREYVRFLVGVANEKMEANRKRTEAFFLALQSESGGFLGPTPANGGTVADGEAELEARDDNAHSDSGILILMILNSEIYLGCFVCVFGFCGIFWKLQPLF